MADPRAASPAMIEHLASCHDCGEFTRQLLGFEDRLDRAARIPTTSRLRVERRRRAWLALAASVLIAVAAAGGLWLAAPGPTLAADVINHMSEEPLAWNRTDVALPRSKVERVMNESHLRLRDGAGLVSYANSCLFRGHTVPHFVVQTATGPVTVMVLAHESVSSTTHFDEQGYRGMLLPVRGHGSLAILERGGSAGSKGLDEVAAQVLAAIDWPG